jgi:hypothetical protein
MLSIAQITGLLGFEVDVAGDHLLIPNARIRCDRSSHAVPCPEFESSNHFPFSSPGLYWLRSGLSSFQPGALPAALPPL